MVTDPRKIQELTETFTEDFSWNGELEFHNEHTVSVKAKGGMAGSLHIRRDVLEFAWEIKSVGGDVRLDRSLVRTFEGAPSYIGRDLEIFYCPNIKDLGGTFDYVSRDLVIKGTSLTNLKGGPNTVDRDVQIYDMPYLESLEGFPSSVGRTVKLTYMPNMGLLRLLVAQKVWLYSDDLPDESRAVENILNNYAGKGKQALFDCQKDLEDAGFEGNARW